MINRSIIKKDHRNEALFVCLKRVSDTEVLLINLTNSDYGQVLLEFFFHIFCSFILHIIDSLCQLKVDVGIGKHHEELLSLFSQ